MERSTGSGRVTYNAPLRAAAKGLASLKGQATGLAGQSLGDHVEATWESHIPEVCTVLDAVSVNIAWKNHTADERFANRAFAWALKERHFRLPDDWNAIVLSARGILYAIRDGGPR